MLLHSKEASQKEMVVSKKISSNNSKNNKNSCLLVEEEDGGAQGWLVMLHPHPQKAREQLKQKQYL